VSAAGRNLLGVDVTGLDVAAFLSAGRLLYLALALAWVGLLLRIRRPAWALAGVVLANAWLWGTTQYPLQRLYALGVSSDRLGNLALVQVVAAGQSPLRTFHVGQLHFEPFWGALVAVLSGFDPDRVLVLYPFLPLVMACGFAVTLYAGLGAGGPDWSPWERAAVAGFATLLCSAPLDHTGLYRSAWTMTFLLKPNHALGLVLFPLMLAAFAHMRTLRGRIAVGLLLHLIGWVFVLHMAYVAAGLALFAAVSWIGGHPDRRDDLRDVATVLLVNLAIVSPYLVMLLVGYPFLVRTPAATIPAASAHLLEVTTRAGFLLPLAAWGAAVAWRRGDRLGRLWTTQWLGALAMWAAYLGLSAIHLARERDEIYYWNRFLLAATAAIGAWDLLGRAAGRIPALAAPHARWAVLALLFLPASLPAWWDPLRMDDYFRTSLEPLPQIVSRPGEYLRHHTDPDAVVAGDWQFARWAAALGARRALLARHLHWPADRKERRALEDLLVKGGDPREIRARAARYGGKLYLVVTPEMLRDRYPGVTLETLDARSDLERVHITRDTVDRQEDFVAIYRLGDS
jgi:hypothetical protein